MKLTEYKAPGECDPQRKEEQNRLSKEEVDRPRHGNPTQHLSLESVPVHTTDELGERISYQ